MVSVVDLEDPQVTIRDLLVANWTTANTPVLGSAEPRFSTGWYSAEIETPQLTITNRDDVPSGGGETGWTAIEPGGAGPIQRVAGTSLVQAWARWPDGQGSSPNPKKVRKQVIHEAMRILHAGASAPGGDLDYLGFSGPRYDVDTDERGQTVFRSILSVRYGYRLTP